VGGAFLVDIRLGVAAWIAAAAHEVPQELGDFAVLIHGGWKKRKALIYNVLSGLAFLVGAVLAYAASFRIDIAFLVPFAAGNFIYIGASDLVPEVNRHDDIKVGMIHLLSFVVGVVALGGIRIAFGG
jgi:zinc and cadmium transporter